MITLRPDQTEAVGALWAALREHQSVMFQAQTGFGKTVCAAFMAQAAHKHDRRIIFAVHRRELMRQTSVTFERFGIPHGFICAGMPVDPFQNVQIASADTLRSRPTWLNCALFVPDEAHLWASKTRAAMINQVRENGGKIVGLSATPQRLDGKPLSDLFDTMVCGPSTEWLMENGHLSRYRAFAPVGPSTEGLHVRNGDYITEELDERFNKPAVIGDAIRTWRECAFGLRTMAFAFSRKHGAALTDAYNQNGIPAVYIDGETHQTERKTAIAAFADSDAFVLVSVNLAIEGFDLSAQVGRDVPVEACSFQRPTMSLPMARQMMGRGLRPKDKPAVFMDHVGLFRKHGFPDDPINWTLDGRTKTTKKAENTVSITTCEECFYTAKTEDFRANENSCPDCGAELPKKDRSVKEVEGELLEIDLGAVRAAKAQAEYKERRFAEMCDTVAEKGYKKGWLIHRLQTPQMYGEDWTPQKADWVKINRELRKRGVDA